MRFYRHWARAEAPVGRDIDDWTVARYAGSDVSENEARREAERLARETAEIFRRGNAPDGYLYSDRPVREEIVDEIQEGGQRIAVITRNAYGSLVLNAASVMFVDIDEAKQHRKRARTAGREIKPGILGRLFGRTADQDARIEHGRSDPVEERVQRLADEMPGMGLRLYRTAAGHRCLITTDSYDPASAEAHDIMSRLGSDPLYMKLCRVQDCFRARLTAKFWRCGATRPPVRFPWADSDHELWMREWEQAYHAKADRVAVCELVAEIGTNRMSDEAARITAVHDEMCLSPGAPLA